MIKLNSKQLREIDPLKIEEEAKKLPRNPIFLILENVYDTYNIGGLFRLADALAVSKIYLCGEMEIPPHHKIAKASVGTYKIVPWEYKETTKEAIEELRETYNAQRKSFQNVANHNEKTLHATRYTLQVIAVEQSKNSIPYNQVGYTFPVALLVGNETYGILPETLSLVDTIVEIPMWGINKSLNVIVSAAVVSYHVATQLKRSEPRAGIEPAL